MGCCSSKDMSIVKYQFSISTSGSYLDAGSDSTVYVNMMGEDGNSTTGWIKLDKFLRDDFEKGNTDEFTVKAKHVGMPSIIRLELRNRKKKDAWACDNVVIKLGDDEMSFPVYDWVEDEISIPRGRALHFTKVDNMAIRNQRSKEIEGNKVRFAWIPRPTDGDIGWGLPRYVNEKTFSDLPKLFQTTYERGASLLDKGFEVVVNSALAKLKGFLNKIDDLESFTRLYQYLHIDSDPEFYDRWKTDEEFGRQQMNGISPLSFCRCTKIPDSCQISSKDVSFFLGGQTLENAMQSGKLYIGDYSEMFLGVNRNKNEKGNQIYCPDAVCLYHVNSDDNLVPIAIQLVPNDPDTIFTPSDSEEDWLLAKMYFRVSLGNAHEWYHHFLLTHNVMEPFAVSLFRCFPRSHPMYKLLRPHLQTVSQINALARETLIKKGTSANKSLAIEGEDLSRKMYKTFDMDDLVIPEVIKKKGLDDPNLLPKNYFRDDVLGLWEIIERYISRVINHYYSSDGEVLQDEDVQAFAKDMVYEGMGWADGKNRGIPIPIKDVQQLVRLSTCIVFGCSAMHSAVNFPQYETYKFIPNSPLGMRLPPHKKGEGNMKRILKSLPDISMATITIEIAYTLSSYSPDEIYLGECPMKLFTDDEVLVIQERFKEELQMFTEKINERNQNTEYPYKYLLPSKIPNSIAV